MSKEPLRPNGGPPRSPAVRSLLLAVASASFLIIAFVRVEGDPATVVVSLVQAVAFSLALVAIAFVDWTRVRWWWLLIAVLVVAIAWTATGHPLLFLVGGI
jgi:Mg2+/citrate symporter